MNTFGNVNGNLRLAGFGIFLKLERFDMAPMLVAVIDNPLFLGLNAKQLGGPINVCPPIVGIAFDDGDLPSLRINLLALNAGEPSALANRHNTPCVMIDSMSHYVA